MAACKCVITVQKPTVVTRSVAGNFTAADHQNLIVSKRTLLEIHRLTSDSNLRLVSEVPVHGIVEILLLFRPHGDTTDSLFVVTEDYKYWVLRWDGQLSDVITVRTGDASFSIGRAAEGGKMGIVDLTSSFICLHLYDALFKILPVGDMEAAFEVLVPEYPILDIKFLDASSDNRPTIGVLIMENNAEGNRHLKTYEVDVEKKELLPGSLSLTNVVEGALSFFPVPSPLGGVVVLGDAEFAYYNRDLVLKVPIAIKYSFTAAIERFGMDGFEYLLTEEFSGQMHSLVIVHDMEKVTRLELIKHLGDQTSVASTISYLGQGLVYLDSRVGDSQLLKLDTGDISLTKKVEVLQSYINIGPNLELSVIDLHKHGQSKVVLCSEAGEDGSLHVIRKGIGMEEKASIEYPGVKAIWSLKSSTTAAFDTFLVVSFVNETRFLAMNSDDELEETEIDGFDSDSATLFCRDVIYDQLVQVTSDGVRLVGSSTRKIRDQWIAPHGLSISVATANSSQVLLTMGGTGRLVYLEIEDGALIKVNEIVVEHDISCLDLSPIREDPHYSKLAAVGMWEDMTVRIFALPTLEQLTKEIVSNEVIARSILLCRFEEVPYLLCALGDGHLFSFHLDVGTGELHDRKKLELGMQPITLRLSSSNNNTQFFATSDNSTVITYADNTLSYTSLLVNDVNSMCSFNTAAFPDCVAVAGEGRLAIGILSDTQELEIHSIPLQEQALRMCHQEQSHKFVTCTAKVEINNDGQLVETRSVCLLDDQNFHTISSYVLDSNEIGLSILSSSFRDDQTIYYCVGTEYMNQYHVPLAGRILFFVVKDKSLQLVAEKKTRGPVRALTSFDGKLLASIDNILQLYKLVVGENGKKELQFEYEQDGPNVPLEIHTLGETIMVADIFKPMSYDYRNGELVKLLSDSLPYSLSSVQFCDHDLCIGADMDGNLVTLARVRDEELNGKFQVVGKYHLGDRVRKIRHGNLVMHHQDSDRNLMRSLLFATETGWIGAVVSLPQDEFNILEKLELCLSKEIKSVGGLSRSEHWRSYGDENKTLAMNFVDGDLIEVFMDLSAKQMEKISKEIGLEVKDLYKKVEKLKRSY